MSKIVKYLLFTFISAYILQIVACHDHNLGNYGGMMSFGNTIAFCMFMPAIGAFIAGADIRGMGWKPDIVNHKKLLLLAWLLPTVTQFLGAAFYYMVFPNEFDTTGIFLQETNPIAYEELEASEKPYASYVIKEFFYSFTAPQIVVSVFLGLGEEIGWRIIGIDLIFHRIQVQFNKANPGSSSGFRDFCVQDAAPSGEPVSQKRDFAEYPRFSGCSSRLSALLLKAVH